MRFIFGAAAFNSAGFKNERVFGQKHQSGLGVAALQGSMECVDGADCCIGCRNGALRR